MSTFATNATSKLNLKKRDYYLFMHLSRQSQKPAFTWLLFSRIGSDLDSILNGVLDSLLARDLCIILAGKHAHQAREDVTVHDSLCEWLNFSGDVHPGVQNGLVRRVEVRGTRLWQDLCAFRQVVDVEYPQKTQAYVLPGVILRQMSVHRPGDGNPTQIVNNHTSFQCCCPSGPANSLNSVAILGSLDKLISLGNLKTLFGALLSRVCL